jgi:hypothetical protein
MTARLAGGQAPGGLPAPPFASRRAPTRRRGLPGMPGERAGFPGRAGEPHAVPLHAVGWVSGRLWTRPARPRRRASPLRRGNPGDGAGRAHGDVDPLAGRVADAAGGHRFHVAHIVTGVGRTALGGVVVTVRGTRPRTVPALARYHAALLAAARSAGNAARLSWLRSIQARASLATAAGTARRCASRRALKTPVRRREQSGSRYCRPASAGGQELSQYVHGGP